MSDGCRFHTQDCDPEAGDIDSADIEQQLQAAVEMAERRSRALRQRLQDRPELLRFMPDVDVFHVAVKRTLEDRIFFKKQEFETAKRLLAMGVQRTMQLAVGKTPWNTATGLVVRAYISRIDGSLQPYGLWVSPDYRKDGNHRRLDIWYHGRNDKLSEVAFLDRRLKRPAPFSPANSIVLYPYGRFCNAMKFAGETDTWEALRDMQKHYDIDVNRISVRGFSMGGAAAWHFGTHHASSWAAVNPGAGFAETEIYQKLTGQLDQFPWYEKKLWRLYDAFDYAINLENTGLVAYSGEVDKQKEAADLMETALKSHGIGMTHIIGPKTGHKYEPGARDQVEELVDRIVGRGRNLIPKQVRFATYTLKRQPYALGDCGCAGSTLGTRSGECGTHVHRNQGEHSQRHRCHLLSNEPASQPAAGGTRRTDTVGSEGVSAGRLVRQLSKGRR